MFLSFLMSINFAAAFRMLELNAPASPFSPDTTISNAVFSGRRTNRGFKASPVTGSYTSARDTSDLSTLVSICAYGRAAKARSWARRSLAAETICMALVICRVFFTLRMRRRISKRFAMFLLCLRLRRRLPFAHKALLEFRQGLLDVGLQLVAHHFLLHDRAEKFGIGRFHILIEPAFER